MRAWLRRVSDSERRGRRWRSGDGEYDEEEEVEGEEERKAEEVLKAPWPEMAVYSVSVKGL